MLHELIFQLCAVYKLSGYDLPFGWYVFWVTNLCTDVCNFTWSNLVNNSIWAKSSEIIHTRWPNSQMANQLHKCGFECQKNIHYSYHKIRILISVIIITTITSGATVTTATELYCTLIMHVKFYRVAYELFHFHPIIIFYVR